MDLKDALEFITDLKEQADEPKVLEIDGRTYIDRNLMRHYKDDYPSALQTYTLTSIVDYIKNLSNEITAGRLVVHIESEKEVALITEVNSEGNRGKQRKTHGGFATSAVSGNQQMDGSGKLYHYAAGMLHGFQ